MYGDRSVGFYYRKGNSNQITSSRGYEWLDLLIVYRDLIKYLKDAISLLPSDVVNAMYNPAMRIMTSLALEGIHMSDVSTRKKLVKELSFFFGSCLKSIPVILINLLKLLVQRQR